MLVLRSTPSQKSELGFLFPCNRTTELSVIPDKNLACTASWEKLGSIHKDSLLQIAFLESSQSYDVMYFLKLLFEAEMVLVFLFNMR